MRLLLLHGAIGSSEQLKPLAVQLGQRFEVHTLDFTGHGGKKLPDGDFSIDLFANDVLLWMEKNAVSTIDIFGYSMGGYVALYLARHYPEKIRKVFTLATKFNWTPEIAQNETKMLNPEKIAEKLPAFAEALDRRHSPTDWKKVLEKTATMMLAMGNVNALTKDDYKLIAHKVTLAIGDKDKMVGIEETTTVFNQLKNADLLVLPDTPHPIEAVNKETLALHIGSFFS